MLLTHNPVTNVHNFSPMNASKGLRSNSRSNHSLKLDDERYQIKNRAKDQADSMLVPSTSPGLDSYSSTKVLLTESRLFPNNGSMMRQKLSTQMTRTRATSTFGGSIQTTSLQPLEIRDNMS